MIPGANDSFLHLFDVRLLRVSSNDGPQEKPEIVDNRGLFLTERIPPGTYRPDRRSLPLRIPSDVCFTGPIAE